MLECSDTIISGITAVMKYCEIPHCIIGIERNKPECIDLLTSLTREMKGVEVKGLPMRYPQGAEKTLVETCTRRRTGFSRMMPAVKTFHLLGFSFIVTAPP